MPKSTKPRKWRRSWQVPAWPQVRQCYCYCPNGHDFAVTFASSLLRRNAAAGRVHGALYRTRMWFSRGRVHGAQSGGLACPVSTGYGQLLSCSWAAAGRVQLDACDPFQLWTRRILVLLVHALELTNNPLAIPFYGTSCMYVCACAVVCPFLPTYRFN